MQPQSLIKFAIALCAFGLAHCISDERAGGTGLGNPTEVGATFSMRTTHTKKAAKTSSVQSSQTDSSVLVTDSAGMALTIREVLANVGKVGIHLPASITCGDLTSKDCQQNEVEIMGPFIMNLMTGRSAPAIGHFKIPEGKYTNVDVQLIDLSAQEAPVDSNDGLKGNSLVIKGSFAYAGKSDRTFSIYLKFNEDIAFSDNAGINVAEPKIANKLYNVVLLLQVEKWFRNANLQSCLDEGSLKLDASGNLQIQNEEPCRQIPQLIRDNIKSSGDLDESPVDSASVDQPQP